MQWISIVKSSLMLCLQLQLFKGNHNGSFHVSEECLYDLFLLISVPGIFSLPKLSMFLLHRLIVAKLYLTHFKKFFLTKTCFSIHITHSYVNLTWFALFCYQKFDDRTLFNSLIFNHLELPPNKYFCKIELIFVMNQFQTIESSHSWKEN